MSIEELNEEQKHKTGQNKSMRRLVWTNVSRGPEAEE